MFFRNFLKLVPCDVDHSRSGGRPAAALVVTIKKKVHVAENEIFVFFILTLQLFIRHMMIRPLRDLFIELNGSFTQNEDILARAALRVNSLECAIAFFCKFCSKLLEKLLIKIVSQKFDSTYTPHVQVNDHFVLQLLRQLLLKVRNIKLIIVMVCPHVLEVPPNLDLQLLVVSLYTQILFEVVHVDPYLVAAG